MKIHPTPTNKRINITTIRYNDPTNNLSRQKKLRKLPHIFEKVLELPFYSDADVSIHETSDSLKFVVDTDDDDMDIDVRTIEICAGVTKLVVLKASSDIGEFGGGCGEVDLWRFRLPECTQPERATAAFSDGELVVTVPKELVRVVLVQ